MESDSKITNIVVALLLTLIGIGVWWLLNRQPEIVQTVDGQKAAVTKQTVKKKPAADSQAGPGAKVGQKVVPPIKPKDATVGAEAGTQAGSKDATKAGTKAVTKAGTDPKLDPKVDSKPDSNTAVTNDNVNNRAKQATGENQDTTKNDEMTAKPGEQTDSPTDAGSTPKVDAKTNNQATTGTNSATHNIVKPVEGIDAKNEKPGVKAAVKPEKASP